MIFEYEPTVGYFFKLSSLNKQIKIFFQSKVESKEIKSICHRDHGKVSSKLLTINYLSHLESPQYLTISLERFIRKLFNYFGHSLTLVDFEFAALTDDHFDQVGLKLPENLYTLNLNGCREISERTLVELSKYCHKLKRIGNP